MKELCGVIKIIFNSDTFTVTYFDGKQATINGYVKQIERSKDQWHDMTVYWIRS